jgi:hypothetical protein
MKYAIQLMTPTGIKTEIYTDDPQSDDFKTLQEFEQDMVNKYGTFVMIKATEIK